MFVISLMQYSLSLCSPRLIDPKYFRLHEGQPHYATQKGKKLDKKLCANKSIHKNIISVDGKEENQLYATITLY
jgi:hypothetical protein